MNREDEILAGFAALGLQSEEVRVHFATLGGRSNATQPPEYQMVTTTNTLTDLPELSTDAELESDPE